MEGILFSKLDELVLERSELSERTSADKWQVMPYRCGDISGRLLFAGELTKAKDVRLKLGLSGFYKIFVGTVNMKSKNLFNLRLSSDEGFSAMSSPTMESQYQWTPPEYFEEFFWKCANLTDEDLILRKPECMWNNGCALAFLRCVPVTNEEYLKISETKGDLIHGHFDEDPNGEDTLNSDYDILTRYPQLTGGDLREMSLEFSFDYDNENADNSHILYQDAAWQRGDSRFIKIKDKAYKKRVDYLHGKGIKVFATNRMSVATFTAPYSNSHWTKLGFVDFHPEFYCKTRLGEPVKVCSYAYPEVRKYVIDRFVEMMKYGFDGVTLILHRGLHIGFEEPVLLEFSRIYPELDPHTLPVTDERLNGVWRSFMTEFMKELRLALDGLGRGRLLINVITDYTPKTSKNFGLDVGEWARLGLIDRVMQGIMETYEELDGVLDEKGLIDLKAYENKLKSEPVIRRFHGTSIEKALEGSRKYKAELDGTNVKYLATLPWPHKCSYSKIEEYKAALREIGITDFLSWNTNHLLLDVAEMHATVGRGEEYYTVNRYRTLMLDGSNMSEFNPNWRG